MNSSRTSLSGDRRPHSERALEGMASDALRKHFRVIPEQPGQISIDRLVEEMFGFNETYENLDRGVLGEIHFGIDERPIAIRLARRLGDLRSPTRRLEQERRVTLAHECAHGIAHSKLFADRLRREKAPLLPGVAEHQTHIACRGRDLAIGSIRPRATATDEVWLEWEANYLMGALLIPQHLLLKVVSPWIAGPPDGIAPRYLPSSRQHVAIEAVAETFDVTLDLAAQRVEIVVPSARHPDFFDVASTRKVRLTSPKGRPRKLPQHPSERKREWFK